MSKIILSMDGLVLKEFTIKNKRVTIGRKPHNDIQIDNMAISGEHAAIINVLDDTFIEDLNSTNGTLVNGQQIRRQVLKNGDIIEMGKYKLKYLADQIDYSEIGVIPTDGGFEPPPSIMGTQVLAMLRIFGNAGVVKETELSKSMTNLGKPGVQVAVITRRSEGYSIAHVEGKSPPLINGVPLDTRAQLLRDHDTIEIAGVRMEFVIKSSESIEDAPES